MRNWLASFLVVLAAITVPAAASAKAPVPIVDGFVVEGFEGWEKVSNRTADSLGIQYMHRPKRPSPVAGSALWFFGANGSDKRGAFLASAKAGGISDVKIVATHLMKKAVLLDSRGSGEVFIADGMRRGKPYRMAALVIHGTLEKDEEPGLGVHMFVAPRDLYAEMGGWIVPASLFLNLDPYRDVSSIPEQGKATPALQARRMAETADIWSQWVLETYIQMAQSNIQAMSNFRKSVVCAGDPNCVIVPGN